MLVHFSDLLPSSKHDQLISLLEKINDDSFKIVSIVRKHRDYGDYYEYLNQTISDKGLNDRLVLLSEDDVLGNSTTHWMICLSYRKGPYRLIWVLALVSPFIKPFKINVICFVQSHK